MEINKKVKEVLNLLLHFRCISKGEYHRIWNDWQNIEENKIEHKHCSETVLRSF